MNSLNSDETATKKLPVSIFALTKFQCPPRSSNAYDDTDQMLYLRNLTHSVLCRLRLLVHKHPFKGPTLTAAAVQPTATPASQTRLNYATSSPADRRQPTAGRTMTDGLPHTAASDSHQRQQPATVDVSSTVVVGAAAATTNGAADKAAANGRGSVPPPVPTDPLLAPTYFAHYDTLATLCTNNIAHFAADESATGLRFRAAFTALAVHLEIARSSADRIRRFAAEYDFDARTPGNGYRSHLLCVDACVRHALQLAAHVTHQRGSLLFRAAVYAREMDAAAALLAALCTLLAHLETLRTWSEPRALFPRSAHSAAELFDTAAAVDQYAFYGRCLGIQYCESMQKVVRFLAVCMAGFSESYYGRGEAGGRGRMAKGMASVWRSGKYLVDPELRARRIVNISQAAEIDFCKEFWSLSEGECRVEFLRPHKFVRARFGESAAIAMLCSPTVFLQSDLK